MGAGQAFPHAPVRREGNEDLRRGCTPAQCLRELCLNCVCWCVQDRETLLVEATSRFEAGEPPTAEAVTLWRRTERAKAAAAELAASARMVRPRAPACAVFLARTLFGVPLGGGVLRCWTGWGWVCDAGGGGGLLAFLVSDCC